jgi:hypothetical protein
MDTRHKTRTLNPVAEYQKNLTASRRLGEEGNEGEITLLDPKEKEWVKLCRRSAVDFTFFVNFMCGVRIHEGQIKVVAKMKDSDYGVLAAANGWGKTFLYALLVLWASFSKQWAPKGWMNYRVAVMAPWMQQSLITHGDVEMIRRSEHEAQVWCEHPAPCEKAFECPDRQRHRFRLSPWLVPFKTPADHEAFRWTHNGAIINFESGEDKAKSVEGWRLNLVIYDEARLELHLKHIVEQVFLARAVRTPNQKILLGSTPLSDSKDLREFFNRGDQGRKDWWSYMGSIRDNCFLFKAQIEKVRASLDERISQQVLEGKWVAPPDSYFISERVEPQFEMGHTVDPLISRLDGKWKYGHLYVGGVDLAVAEGGDESVFTIWDITWNTNPEKPDAPCRMIYERTWRGRPIGDVIEACDAAIQVFNCVIGFDASSAIGIEFEHQVTNYETYFIPVKFYGGNQLQTSQIKNQALANMKHFINNKLIGYPYLPETMAQFTSYQLKDQHLVKDRLMAQVYAAWVAKDFALRETSGLRLRGLSTTSYVGSGTPYGGLPGIPPGEENKTPIQRLAMRLSRERDVQRELEEAYRRS